MNRSISIALLIVGVVLLVYGVQASDSFHSSLSRFFTGWPTHKTTWLLIGGLVLAVVGLSGILRRAK